MGLHPLGLSCTPPCTVCTPSLQTCTPLMARVCICIGITSSFQKENRDFDTMGIKLRFSFHIIEKLWYKSEKHDVYLRSFFGRTCLNISKKYRLVVGNIALFALLMEEKRDFTCLSYSSFLKMRKKG